MSDTYLTRNSLIRKLKLNHSEDAWKEFLFFYKSFICSIIRAMGINEADIDDICQQVLLRVWKAIDKFDINQKKGRFRSWIYKITKNTTLTYMSKLKTKSSKLEILKGDLENKFENPEIDEIVQEEWNKHISKLAFENISAATSKKVVDAFVSYIKGEQAELTAERLGVSKDTLYIYRNRVKQKLTDEIANLKEMLE